MVLKKYLFVSLCEKQFSNIKDHVREQNKAIKAAGRSAQQARDANRLNALGTIIGAVQSKKTPAALSQSKTHNKQVIDLGFND